MNVEAIVQCGKARQTRAAKGRVCEQLQTNAENCRNNQKYIFGLFLFILVHFDSQIIPNSSFMCPWYPFIKWEDAWWRGFVSLKNGNCLGKKLCLSIKWELPGEEAVSLYKMGRHFGVGNSWIFLVYWGNLWKSGEYWWILVIIGAIKCIQYNFNTPLVARWEFASGCVFWWVASIL